MPETTDVCSQLCCAPRRFLVTGVAGFIGSHILQALLELGQTVVGLDNFTTGTHANLARCGNEHSRASIEYARLVLGYTPAFDLRRGIDDTVAWHAARRLRVPRVESVDETSGP